VTRAVTNLPRPRTLWALAGLLLASVLPAAAQTPPPPPSELPGALHPGGPRVARFLPKPPDEKPEPVETWRIDFAGGEPPRDVLFTTGKSEALADGVRLVPENYWLKIEVPFLRPASEVDYIEIHAESEESQITGLMVWQKDGVNRRRNFSFPRGTGARVAQVRLSVDRFWTGEPEKLTIQFRGIKKPLVLQSLRFLKQGGREVERIELVGEPLMARRVTPGESFDWEIRLPDEEAYLVVSPGLHKGAGAGNAPVQFAVLAGRGASLDTLYSRVLTLGNEKDAGWQTAWISLADYAGGKVRLVFATRAVGDVHPLTRSRILWGEPIISTYPGRDAFHVVLIGIDTLRRDHFSCYGFEHPITPHMDRLADDGALFLDAMTTSPWTLPSFASVLTGQYPTTHGGGKRTGAQTKGREPLTAALSNEAPLLQVILKKQKGFRTAFFYNNPYLNSRYGVPRGFDKAEQVRGGGWKNVGATLGWMRANLEHRMFVFLHLMEPHRPYKPPEPFKQTALDWFADDRREAALTPAAMPDSLAGPPARGKDQKGERHRRHPALYAGEVLYTDNLVGTLARGLAEMGILDDCLIIITADHGEEFWEHDAIEYRNYNDPRGFWGAGHGHSQFQELVAAPLIIRFPGRVEPGTRVEDLVQIHDIAPTVLDWVGLPEREDMSGRSLVPAIHGEGHRGYAFSEFILYGDDRRAYREGRWKLILGPDRETAELYDLQEDPGEHNNLREARPDVVERLITALEGVEERARDLRSRYYASAGEEEKPAEVDEKTRRELKSLGYVD
jgi:arylsulfatase A-like enzyme